MSDNFSYTLVRKKIKNLRITVKSSGDIIVSAPWFYLKWQIDKVVESKKDWIKKRVETFKQNKSNFVLDASKIHYLGEVFEPVLDDTRKDDFIDFENKTIYSKLDLNNAKNKQNWYKKTAKAFIENRVLELVTIYGLKIGKITVRTQKTRWGSCTAKNNISLNSTLIMCPPKIIDYVIFHELSHITQKNHSKKFWDLAGIYAPDYIESRKWLKNNGSSMIVS